MGIISKYVTAKLTEGVIETVGRVTLETTVGIMSKKAEIDKSDPSKKKIRALNVNDLIGQHYLKVRAKLINAGFTDISFVEKKDLIKGWLIQDGEVAEVSIGGETEFNRTTKFFATTPVVITYHTFRNK